MRTSFLSQVDGFTPLIDAMVQEYDLLTAAVYGRVWRYCQMKDGVCRASHEKIADELGLSRQTVLRKVHFLCDEEYLRDLTPNRRNKPHEYADTGKAKIMGLVQARIDDGVTENDSGVTENDSGVTENDSRCNRESHEDSSKIVSKKVPPQQGPDPFFRKLQTEYSIMCTSPKHGEMWKDLLDLAGPKLFWAALNDIVKGGSVPNIKHAGKIVRDCREQGRMPGEWPDRDNAPDPGGTSKRRKAPPPDEELMTNVPAGMYED